MNDHIKLNKQHLLMAHGGTGARLSPHQISRFRNDYINRWELLAAAHLAHDLPSIHSDGDRRQYELAEQIFPSRSRGEVDYDLEVLYAGIHRNSFGDRTHGYQPLSDREFDHLCEVCAPHGDDIETPLNPSNEQVRKAREVITLVEGLHGENNVPNYRAVQLYDGDHAVLSPEFVDFIEQEIIALTSLGINNQQ